MDTASQDIIQIIIGKDHRGSLCRFPAETAYYFLNTLACLNKHWNRQMLKYRITNATHEKGVIRFWRKWNWNYYRK